MNKCKIDFTFFFFSHTCFMCSQRQMVTVFHTIRTIKDQRVELR